MAKAEYAYTAIELPPTDVYPSGKTAYRPIVSATVTASNGNAVRSLVLLDSGADACLFSMEMANQLSLDISQLPNFLTGGVGSTSNVTYYDTVTVDLGDGVRFEAYAAFTRGLDQVGLGLLGQSGFFEQFRVQFDHRRKTFSIETA